MQEFYLMIVCLLFHSFTLVVLSNGVSERVSDKAILVIVKLGQHPLDIHTSQYFPITVLVTTTVTLGLIAICKINCWLTTLYSYHVHTSFKVGREFDVIRWC